MVHRFLLIAFSSHQTTKACGEFLSGKVAIQQHSLERFTLTRFRNILLSFLFLRAWFAVKAFADTMSPLLDEREVDARWSVLDASQDQPTVSFQAISITPIYKVSRRGVLVVHQIVLLNVMSALGKRSSVPFSFNRPVPAVAFAILASALLSAKVQRRISPIGES